MDEEVEKEISQLSAPAVESTTRWFSRLSFPAAKDSRGSKADGAVAALSEDELRFLLLLLDEDGQDNCFLFCPPPRNDALTVFVSWSVSVGSLLAKSVELAVAVMGVAVSYPAALELAVLAASSVEAGKYWILPLCLKASPPSRTILLLLLLLLPGASSSSSSACEKRGGR